jgi:hypothetical protein
MSGQPYDPVPLLLGRQPQVNIGQEAGWAPEPVWTLWRADMFFFFFFEGFILLYGVVVVVQNINKKSIRKYCYD